MKAMDSFARLGAHRSHSLCYGEDVQRRMADEDAVSCFGIYGAEYQAQCPLEIQPEAASSSTATWARHKAR